MRAPFRVSADDAAHSMKGRVARRRRYALAMHALWTR